MQSLAPRRSAGPVSGAVWLLGLLLVAAPPVPGEAAPAPAAVAPTSPTAVAAAPTSPPATSDPVAIKWLRTLEERHRDHRRASGLFRQAKIDPVFNEKIQATGRFYYERPSSFRCDYDSPTTSTNLVVGDLVTLYFPDIKQVERYRLSRSGSGIGEVNQMLLAFGIETDKVLKHFTVQSDPVTSPDVVRLTFLPKARREDRPFQKFVLDLSKTDLSPKRLEIVGDDGDVTVIDVTEIKWNDPKVQPDTFQLNLPRDVEIIEQE